MLENFEAKPIPFDPSFEYIDEYESHTIQKLLETLQSISHITSTDYDHAVRSVHAKCHGILRGKIIVKESLPPELKQGLFKESKTYPVVIRFSTSPGDILADSVSTPRGMAIKILNVEDERVDSSNSDSTQDFLCVNGPAFIKPDAISFLSSLILLAKTTDKAEGLKKVLSSALQGTEKLIETFGGESPTIKSMGGHPETNILGETFFSQVPILYGQYMAKVSIEPATQELIALKNSELSLDDNPDGIREAVSDFFNNNSARWDLKIQLCRNLETMPIEDASVIWPEEESPYITVASIEIDPQTSWDDITYPLIEDKLAFSPWNCIKEHRPLGSIMRARRLTYQQSKVYRKQFNGCPLQEISSINDL